MTGYMACLDLVHFAVNALILMASGSPRQQMHSNDDLRDGDRLLCRTVKPNFFQKSKPTVTTAPDNIFVRRPQMDRIAAARLDPKGYADTGRVMM